MDKRKINYPTGFNGSALFAMFEMQKDLINHYIAIEKMPMYPINISERSGQEYMRGFIRRGIEELSEAHHIFQIIYDIMDKNKTQGLSNPNMLDLVLDFNEELSDALHFFIESMLYANIDSDDVSMFYETKCKDMGLGFNRSDPLQNMVTIARQLLSDQNYYFGDNGFITIDINKEEAFYRNCAGRMINLQILFQQAQLMWDVTHNFCKATNLLKNNPWKQTDEDTDPQQFQNQMMNGWLSLMNLLVFSGYNAEGIILSYFHKNFINQQRIKEKR